MDNGEEAVIMGRGGCRIGSLQGRVTSVGPWSVYKQYVDEVTDDTFDQDDLASFYVYKDLGTQETLPLRYWAAAKAPYTWTEDGVIEPGPLRKLCIFKDGRRYFAVCASFYPHTTIRKHQLQEERRDDSDVTEAEEKDALEKLLLRCCVGGSAQTQGKTLDYHGYAKVFHAQALPQPRLEDVALAIFTIGDEEVHTE